MRAQGFFLATLASFWAASALECWDDPEIDLCDHATDLNDGDWSLKDINWYRRSVTRANKGNLHELMGMNETNETELMLVTPLSEAPTPMPPTPAPTPIPQDVVTVQNFGEIASALSFVSAGVAAALTDGLAGATIETTFEIGVTADVNPVPSEAECKATYAIVMSLAESAVACTSPSHASGRRLQSGTISVTGQTTDAATADAAKVAAGDSTALQTALASVDSTKFANVVASGVTTKLGASTKVTQTAADPEEAAKLQETTQQKVSDNKATAAQAAGVDVSTLADATVEVQQVPTPMPTKVPTNMPTALPPGLTAAPTRTPTYMPTKSPTAMPTKMPTAMPTAMPTKMPTAMPTAMPTKMPTATPTAMPTAMPTNMPTANPTTVAPTPAPPTSAPTMSPTNATEEESGANLGGAGFLTVAVLAFATLVA